MRRSARILISVLFLCLAGVVRAQDKNDWYYSDHTNEILPDARRVFQKGLYSRTIELCNLHRDLLGFDHAESPARDDLVALALKCQKLATDLENYIDDGYMQAAKAVAGELKALNPYDERLKQFGLYTAPPVEPEPVVVEEAPKEKEKPQEEEKPVVVKDDIQSIIKNREKEVAVEDGYEEPVEEVAVAAEEYEQEEVLEDEPFFAARGGVAMFGFGQGSVAVGPAVSGGLYNIGYSVVGIEVQGYYCGISSNQSGIMGLNVLAAFRLAPWLYPKVGVGIFDCMDLDKSISKRDNQAGICIPVGVNLVLGRHFSVGLSGTYFNDLNVWQVSTQKAYGNSEYELRTVKTVLVKSVSVMVTVGYAF